MGEDFAVPEIVVVSQSKYKGKKRLSRSAGNIKNARRYDGLLYVFDISFFALRRR
jgi:hypothetical protein